MLTPPSSSFITTSCVAGSDPAPHTTHQDVSRDMLLADVSRRTVRARRPHDLFLKVACGSHHVLWSDGDWLHCQHRELKRCSDAMYRQGQSVYEVSLSQCRLCGHGEASRLARNDGSPIGPPAAQTTLARNVQTLFFLTRPVSQSPVSSHSDNRVPMRDHTWP